MGAAMKAFLSELGGIFIIKEEEEEEEETALKVFLAGQHYS